MLHNIDLILTLTGGLTAALVLGFITQHLRLSPIVGYLIAGVIVGPFTPGFVADSGIAEQFAELGVILLMFGVGLHFHLSELIAVRKVAVPGAIVQISAATALGAAITHLAGWSLTAGLVYGIAISVASTVVLLRVLADNDDLHTRSGHVAVGWLLVEDLFTILVLVLLPVLVGATGDAHGAAPSQSLGLAIGLALLKIGALIAFTLVVGQRVIPALLAIVARTRSRELFTLTVLVIALGIAVGAAKLFGASMALGAFLAGMVVGQSDFSSRAASEALPLRDAFAVLFFVSMGMLFDPMSLMDNLGLTLATLAVIIIGKPLAALAVVSLLGHPIKTALAVSVALAQIGEFSFMLAALGTQLDVLPKSATQSLVAASIISITLNPFLYRLVAPLSRRLSRGAQDDAQAATVAVDAAHRAIVVGYGPVGQSLAALLREYGVTPSVVELNHDTVRTLREQGTHAVYGDASQQDILVSAGVHDVKSLIAAGAGDASPIIEAARALNPALLIIARANYLSEVPALRAAGADVVVSAEGELALAMTERVLEQIGATAEQLDRARDHVRASLQPNNG